MFASQERVTLDALAWFVTLTAGHRYFRVPKNLTFETRLSANLRCENEFFCIIIKNHFHMNGFALSLALKVRFFLNSEMAYFLVSQPLRDDYDYYGRPKNGSQMSHSLENIFVTFSLFSVNFLTLTYTSQFHHAEFVLPLLDLYQYVCFALFLIDH